MLCENVSIDMKSSKVMEAVDFKTAWMTLILALLLWLCGTCSEKTELNILEKFCIFFCLWFICSRLMAIEHTLFSGHLGFLRAPFSVSKL